MTYLHLTSYIMITFGSFSNPQPPSAETMEAALHMLTGVLEAGKEVPIVGAVAGVALLTIIVVQRAYQTSKDVRY